MPMPNPNIRELKDMITGVVVGSIDVSTFPPTITWNKDLPPKNLANGQKLYKARKTGDK